MRLILIGVIVFFALPLAAQESAAEAPPEAVESEDGTVEAAEEAEAQDSVEEADELVIETEEEAVEEATEDWYGEGRLSAAEAEYRRNRILMGPRSNTLASLLSSEPDYYLGATFHRLSPPELYQVLGEEKLARRARRSRPGLALATGLGLGLAGGIAAGSIAYFGGSSAGLDTFGAVSMSVPFALFGVMISIPIGLGVGMLLFLGERHPVGVPERHRMIEEYNRELRRDLGLE